MFLCTHASLSRSGVGERSTAAWWWACCAKGRSLNDLGSLRAAEREYRVRVLMLWLGREVDAGRIDACVASRLLFPSDVAVR